MSSRRIANGQSGVIPPESGLPGKDRMSVTEIKGSGFDGGILYGESSSDLIKIHLESVLERALNRKGLSEGELYARAKLFEPHVRSAVPDIADEIDGIAKGAQIPAEAAWLLQLRAEVSRVDPNNLPSECTSFGVSPEFATPGTIAGQNADLPPFYQNVLVLLKRHVPGRPSVLTLTPAGQVGWHGLNSSGVAVFANFLYSDGWRPGIPRYLFTRIALESDTARSAARRLTGMHRGSSRNLLLADEKEVFDLELAVGDWGIDEAADGVVAHANHHVSSIKGLELAPDSYLSNSQTRHHRMRHLVTEARPGFDVGKAIAILRDRSGVPDALCRAPEDNSDDDDTITVASTVADVANRRLWIAVGPPHVGAYHEYQL